MKIAFDPKSAASFIRLQSSCAEKMAEHFKSLRHDVSAKEPWTNIRNALEISIVLNAVSNYREGAVQVQRNPDSKVVWDLRTAGMARAKWITSEMRGWTVDSLVASKKSKLLSLARANKVSIYESRKSAFNGRVKGWQLNKAARKEWFLSDAHDQDDLCDDNADDGVINMGEAFTSGDMAPPGHLFCMCSLWLHI